MENINAQADAYMQHMQENLTNSAGRATLAVMKSSLESIALFSTSVEQVVYDDMARKMSNEQRNLEVAQRVKQDAESAVQNTTSAVQNATSRINDLTVLNQELKALHRVVDNESTRLQLTEGHGFLIHNSSLRVIRS